MDRPPLTHSDGTIRRKSCLLVTDVSPHGAALPPWLMDGRTAFAWRFHVAVTGKAIGGWCAAMAASDPLSGWVLAANVYPEDQAILARDRAATLAAWLDLLHDRGFRAHGSSTGDGPWSAAVDFLDDRRFDEVVLVGDYRGFGASLNRFADRVLVWRLRRRYAIRASAVPA